MGLGFRDETHLRLKEGSRDGRGNQSGDCCRWLFDFTAK